MGFIIHFYIIFGTNLLTGGPAQNCCFFCLFQSFAEKEYQTESKWNETFGNVIFGTNMTQRTWTLRQESNQESTRQGARLPLLGAPSTLVGRTLLHRCTSSSYIYLRTPKPIEASTKTYFHRRNLLYPWDPILGPFPASCRRGHWSRRASKSTP